MTVIRAFGDGAWRDPQYFQPAQPGWPDNIPAAWVRYTPDLTEYPCQFEFNNSLQGWYASSGSSPLVVGPSYFDQSGVNSGDYAYSPDLNEYMTRGEPYYFRATTELASWGGTPYLPGGNLIFFFDDWRGTAVDLGWASVGVPVTIQSPTVVYNYAAPSFYFSHTGSPPYTARVHYAELFHGDGTPIVKITPGKKPHYWNGSAWIPQDAPFSLVGS